MDNEKKGIVFLIIILFALISYNYFYPVNIYSQTNNINNIQNINSEINNGNTLNSTNLISTKKEFINFLEQNEKKKNLEELNTNSNIYDAMPEVRTLTKSLSDDSVKSMEINEENNADLDYSSTNNYEKNVDESDIVKTEGNYIYTISGNTLNIVGVDNGILNETSIINFDLNYSLKDILIDETNNNRYLIVFLNFYDKKSDISYNLVPYERRVLKTKAIVYDLKDIEKPRKLKEFKISGRFQEARKINNNIYFFSKESNYFPYRYFLNKNLNMNLELPSIEIDNHNLGMPNIKYFDIKYDNFVYYNLVSFDLDKINNINFKNLNISKNQSYLNNGFYVKSYLLSNMDTFYMTDKNIYLVLRNNKIIDNIELFKKASKDIIDKSVYNKIKNLNNYDEISKILKSYYSTLSKKELKDLMTNLNKKLNFEREDFYNKNQFSEIYKFNINGIKINFKSKNNINGYLLNQFSLNEGENETLRVVTTNSYWKNQRRETYNNLYILNRDLNKIGEIENIARDERIKSSRFMGDKLYLVTFKQIDPFFVIDLSNPKKPEIMGKIKLPGYSTYLQPYDKNYIFGIGYYVDTNKFGNQVNNGIQINLFDVRNKNPKLVDTYLIKGDFYNKYIDSISLREHKSILFSKKKNLLVIPITERISNYNNDDKNNYNVKNKINNYALVLNISENGFNELGKITHSKEINDSYWNSPYFIMRSLYINNYLYTISSKMIMSNDFLNNLKEISNINLKYSEKENMGRIIVY